MVHHARDEHKLAVFVCAISSAELYDAIARVQGEEESTIAIPSLVGQAPLQTPYGAPEKV